MTKKLVFFRFYVYILRFFHEFVFYISDLVDDMLLKYDTDQDGFLSQQEFHAVALQTKLI